MAKKFNSREEVLSYVQSLSLQEIVNHLVDAMWLKQNERNNFVTGKIVVSEEQLSDILSMFKVRGKTETGEVEKRGRKRKTE